MYDRKFTDLKFSSIGRSLRLILLISDRKFNERTLWRPLTFSHFHEKRISESGLDLFFSSREMRMKTRGRDGIRVELSQNQNNSIDGVTRITRRGERSCTLGCKNIIRDTPIKYCHGDQDVSLVFYFSFFLSSLTWT